MSYTENKLPSGLDEKATPIDADVVIVGDSADSNRAKKTTWTQVKSFLKTYFDTVYAPILGVLENIVEDTTPQLGGNLDVNGKTVTSVSNGDITLAPNGTGTVGISGTNGLDVNPGSDVDTDLLTVGVTDSPKLSWNETTRSFNLSKGLSVNGNLSGSNVYATTGLYVGGDVYQFGGGGSGTKLVDFTATASAVNGIGIKNNTTGNAPEVQATGTDTNIDLKLVPKGTGNIVIESDIQLGETDIKLDAVLSGDEKWSGIVTAGTAGATLTVGDVCYLASSGKWLPVDGILDGTDTGFDKMIGMCVLASTDTNPTEMLLQGKIRSATLPTLTVGSPVYLADTAGTLTTTLPTTTNFAVRIVGYGVTAEDLYFNPSNEVTIHL